MRFQKAAEIFQKIEDTSSRLEMIDIIVEFFEKAGLDESKKFAYLIEGRLAPQFVPSEFNFSEKSLLNAFSELAKAKELRFDVEGKRVELGDIGLVAQELRDQINSSSSQGEITLGELYSNLWEIVYQEGTGSVERKTEQVLDTFSKLSPIESKYFARIVAGKLRLGLNVKTVLDTLSVFSVGDKSLRDQLDIAFGFDPDIGHLIGVILRAKGKSVSIDTVIDKFEPVPGVPFLPRLVQRVGSLEEGFERLGKGLILQPKYDGLRCQIHKGVDYDSKNFDDRVWSKFFKRKLDLSMEGEEMDMFSEKAGGDDPAGASQIKLFSRDLKDITAMFPEIIEAAENLPCNSCIIDSEIAGTDENGDFIEFQDTMTRRRKYGVDDKASEIPVKAYAFDMLYLDSENLASRDLKVRLDSLENLIDGPSEIVYSDSIEIKDLLELEENFEKFVEMSLEGVIIKLPRGEYIPGVRNFDWIKLKKSIESKVVDTVDLVILGYYHGSGKQTKFGMGALLGGVYDRESDKFVPTTKIGTGVTEDQWEKVASRLEGIEVKERPQNVIAGDYIEPDVWVTPEVVAVVEADEISKSKVYPAGKDHLGFGLALRFPRLKVWDRQSKNPDQATTVGELVELYGLKSG